MDASSENPLGILYNASILVDDGKIISINPDVNEADKVVDLKEKIVMPGLIDCHTHLVFAGDRSDEFNLRSKGASYAEIMKTGGGILNTVKAVRNASVDELYEVALPKLESIYKTGVRTLEIKSGYGLSLEGELKMLEVIHRLNKATKLDLYATFLGAHVVPPEMKKEAYVDHICKDMLPAVKEQGVAKACDIFVEAGAFDLKDAEKILNCAKELDFDLQMHAEQLSHTGATKLACDIGAACVGHLEYVTDDDIEALSRSNTVACVLPVAQEFLRSKQKTPARKIIDAGVKVAVATDYNPGSAMCHNLWWAARLGIACCDMSCEDAMLGMTAHAAEALGLRDRGQIKPGMKADFIVLDGSSPWHKLYDWSND